MESLLRKVCIRVYQLILCLTSCHHASSDGFDVLFSLQIQKYLGPVTVKTSHELITLERDGKEWVSNFRTPDGDKVQIIPSILSRGAN